MDKSTMEDVTRLWESIVPRESVLIEYDSPVLPYKGFHYLISWAEEKQRRIMIIDVLDTLSSTRLSSNSLGYTPALLIEPQWLKSGEDLTLGMY